MQKNREKVGKLSHDLLKQPVEYHKAIDLQKETEQDYIKELRFCAEKHADIFPGDFFIQVLTQKETLMPNVLRNKFMALNACPRPDFDQSLFIFKKSTQQIEYLWTIPDKESCLTLLHYQHMVVPAERQLLKHVLDMYNGRLTEIMKKFNNEKDNSPEINK